MNDPCAELRAEVERLKSDYSFEDAWKEALEDGRALVRERDMLRAEREVWGNIAQERNDLRAEVERLRAALEKVTEEREAWRTRALRTGPAGYALLPDLDRPSESVGREGC